MKERERQSSKVKTIEASEIKGVKGVWEEWEGSGERNNSFGGIKLNRGEDDIVGRMKKI